MPERLTKPWTVKAEDSNCLFFVETADGFPVVYVHHQRPWMMDRLNPKDALTKEQALVIANAIARIPDRQWPADVKAALKAVQAKWAQEGVPIDFDEFVQFFVRDRLIGLGELPLGEKDRGLGARKASG